MLSMCCHVVRTRLKLSRYPLELIVVQLIENSLFNNFAYKRISDIGHSCSYGVIKIALFRRGLTTELPGNLEKSQKEVRHLPFLRYVFNVLYYFLQNLISIVKKKKVTSFEIAVESV